MDSSDCIISPEENQTKVCTSCREDLPLSAFYRQAKGRFGRRSQCKECEKGYFRQWQSGNESRREYMRNYLRNYVSENKERLQEKSKEYYQENGQRIRDRMKDYYLKNTEEIKERVREWEKNNPDKVRELGRRKSAVRRARLAGVVVEEVPTLQELLDDQGGVCVYCDAEGDDVAWEIDHIMPIILGGSHTPDNVQVLCKSCNSRKGGKHPLQFLAEQRRIWQISTEAR